MKIIKERFYHIIGTPNANEIKMGSAERNYIKAEVYYDEGGYSYLSYKHTPRAYFICVYKIGRGKDSCGFWESHEIFTPNGAKAMVCEVTRQSKKKETEAVEYFETNIEKLLREAYGDVEVELEV